MNTSPNVNPGRRRAVRAMLGGLGLAVFLGGIGLWWFLRDDAPDDVSLGAAVESLEEANESPEETSGSESPVDTTTDEVSDTEAVDAGTIDGTWTVDTEIGDFDYESATGSFVGFRIEEELNSIGSTTAVGRTGDVVGSMVIEGSTVVSASFDVDMTTITTNSSMRDDNVQEALETGDFPSASFVLTSPIELGDDAATGAAVSATAAGDMTIHGVTNPVSFAMDAQLVDGVVIAVGTTEITFADFDVVVPDGGPVISVDDFGVLELQFLLTPDGNG